MIRIQVDASNPGHFFGCCGLLELAQRVWPGAHACFEGREFVVSEGDLAQLVAETARSTIEVLEPSKIAVTGVSPPATSAMSRPTQLLTALTATGALAASFAGAFCSLAIAQSPAVFSRIDTVPDAHCHVVWDSDRQRLLAFERYQDGALWQQDGSGWVRRLGVALPPLSTTQCAVYDSVRQRVLLLGAVSYSWNDAGWQIVPGLSVSSTLAVFDAARDRIVVHDLAAGGFREWHGTAWSPLPAGPQWRADPAMVYDSTLQRVVPYGGTAASTQPLADCWSYDGSSWTQLSANAAPGPRSRTSLADDPAQARLVLYGEAGPSTATWSLAGTSWTQLTATNAFGPRQAPHLIRDGNGLLLFGGSQQFGHDHWRLIGSTWQPLESEPDPRWVTQFAYDPVRQEAVLFSGGTGGRLVQDTWTFDGTWQRRTVTPEPPRRAYGGIAWSAVNNAVVLFGGEPGLFTAPLADTWLWNGMAWSQSVPLTTPPPRHGHAMAADPQGGVLLYGGFDGAAQQNDHWYWNGATWLPQPQPPMATLLSPVAGFDATRQVTLLYGLDAVTSQPQAWQWNGTLWTAIPAPPLTTAAASLCLQRDTGRMLLDALSSSCQWDGVQWSSPITSAATTLTRASIDYPPLGRVLAFAHRDNYQSVGSVSVLTTTNAEATSLGAGCSNGTIPALSLRGPAGPYWPTTELAVATYAPQAPTWFALALTSSNLPLGGGCTLWIGAPVATVLTLTDSHGDAALAIAVPANSALLGFRFTAQNATLDPPNSSFVGLTLSNGLSVTLGH